MSLSKPILIAGITAFLAYILTSILPQEWSYFTIAQETALLESIRIFAQRIIYLSSGWIDWRYVLITIKIAIAIFFAKLTWSIANWVMDWWKFSQ